MNNAVDKDKREKLLEVAAQLFSEKGFHGASVREICQTAGANQAAINYYFGSKEELYREVLTYAFDSLSSGSPMPCWQTEQDPYEVLNRWIQWYLKRILGENRSNLVTNLIAKELREPTVALDLLVQRSMKPLYAELKNIVSAILKNKASEDQVNFCCTGIVGQCLIYKIGRPMIDRLQDYPNFDEQKISQIAEHIFESSKRGLEFYTDR